MGGILDTPSGQPSGEVHAYLFEAKGIQRYIFDSGMLQDIIGAMRPCRDAVTLRKSRLFKDDHSGQETFMIDNGICQPPDETKQQFG